MSDLAPGEPAAGSAVPETTEVPSARTSIASRSADADRCPACGTTRIVDDSFCEECGNDFASSAHGEAHRQGAVRWEALVVVDAEHYARGDWPGLELPTGVAPVRVALDEPEVRIGRGDQPSGRMALDLDDPAVSRLHAVLVRDEDDGSYAVVDKGSTNGTLLNGAATPLAVHVPVPLADGDRIHVGAWTTIVLKVVPGLVS